MVSEHTLAMLEFSKLVAWLAPPEGPFGSPPLVAPLTIVVIVCSLAVVGVLAGLIPALRAARVPPAEALRAS